MDAAVTRYEAEAAAAEAERPAFDLREPTPRARRSSAWRLAVVRALEEAFDGAATDRRGRPKIAKRPRRPGQRQLSVRDAAQRTLGCVSYGTINDWCRGGLPDNSVSVRAFADGLRQPREILLRAADFYVTTDDRLHDLWLGRARGEGGEPPTLPQLLRLLRDCAGLIARCLDGPHDGSHAGSLSEAAAPVRAELARVLDALGVEDGARPLPCGRGEGSVAALAAEAPSSDGHGPPD